MPVFVHHRALCALMLILAFLVPARASPDPEHRVLASGQLRLGNIYRERFRRLLSTTALEEVAILDANLEGYQFQAIAKLDLHAENTLTPDAIVDFTNRIHAEYDSPDDIQAGRYRYLDNRFQAIWGLALDGETTLKTDLLVRNHYDVLFPQINALSADASLTLDTALSHHRWLTFGFTGDATFFMKEESPDYFEGFGRVAYQWHDPRRAHYVTLPTSVKYPAQPDPAGAVDAFRYGPELGLHESKKQFPLASESMIGRAAPAPLVVSAADQLFTEVEEAGADFGEVQLGLRGRDYRAAPFSDWRRLELDASYQFNPARGLAIEVSNQFHGQDYVLPQAAIAQTDRFSDRFRLQAVRTRKRARQTVYTAVGFHRLPGGERFDAVFYEGGITSLGAFGRRYWWYSDTFFTALVPDTPAGDYPEKQNLSTTLGFTVDFSPVAHLSLSTRRAKITVPRFENLFDSGFTDDIQELRYHHQVRCRYAIETGVRGVRRHSASTPDDNRREALFFLDTVLDL